MITQLLIAIIYFWAKDSCNYCEIAAANCKRGMSKPTRHCVGRQICHQDTVFSVFPQSHLELPQQLLHAALFLQSWLWESRQDHTIHWPDTGCIYDVWLLCWTGRSKKVLKSIENLRQLGVNAWSMIKSIENLRQKGSKKHRKQLGTETLFPLLVWHDNWASLFLVILWCLYCSLSSIVIVFWFLQSYIWWVTMPWEFWNWVSKCFICSILPCKYDLLQESTLVMVQRG